MQHHSPELPLLQGWSSWVTPIATGVWQSVSGASKGMYHIQAPKNHSGDRKTPHPVPSPCPLLLVSPVCPAQHLPLLPLSIPFKLILLCRAQAKAYSQRPISDFQTQKGAVNREHNDLYSVRVEVYTRAKYYHSQIYYKLQHKFIYNALDFVAFPLRYNHTLVKYSPEPSFT